MKKKILLLVLSVVVMFTLVPPQTGQASELDRINKQLADLKQQMRSAENKQQVATEKIKAAEAGKEKTEADLQQITTQIDSTAKEMYTVSSKIDQSEANLEENGKQLEEANVRITERSGLLDSRVQLMYMNGNVSYLDVLFSATSFSDFISRLDSLEVIANQDKQILEDHKRDKRIVLEKKKEIEAELKEVRSLYAKLDETKKKLRIKEKEKDVMIAGFDSQIEEMHGLSEEQDAMLVQFLQQRSALEQDKVVEVEKARKKRQQAEEERRRKAAAAAANAGNSGNSGESSGSSGSGQYSGGKFAVPLKVDYVITSQFGSRTDPITGRKNAYHSGMDMAAPGGSSIYAAESGVVILAEWWSGYGNCVIIDHGDGVWTLYGHIRNNGIKVSKGDQVDVGDKIAEVGTTGNSTGNHLHFEVRVNGEKVNPASYLQ